MAILLKSILKSHTRIVVCILFLLCLTTVTIYAQQLDGKVRKIVIDAGHGGKDPGAIGRIYYEKDIVLPVALRLGRLINERMPDVEVIYTRKKDVFVELGERANIANKAHADLFVSIHANASENRDITGTETYVMGLRKSEANLQVAMRENSVIQYEDDYQTKYEDFDPSSPESYIIFSLMQNAYLLKSIELAEMVQSEFKKSSTSVDRGVKQDIFLVLWRTAAPSILVELGFMSNITEEQKLGDLNAQQDLAESLFKAIQKYKNRMENVKTESDTVHIDNNVIDTIAPIIEATQPIIEQPEAVEVQVEEEQVTQPHQTKRYNWITK